MPVARFTAPAPHMVDLSLPFAHPVFAKGAHLELEAINPTRAPLPMTETGYRSHFHPVGTIEKDFDGDVVEAVTHWLDKRLNPKSGKAILRTLGKAVYFNFRSIYVPSGHVFQF